MQQFLCLSKAEDKKKAAQVLRNKGNHLHNCNVISSGKGELVIARVPADASVFDYKNYSPCDICYGWYKVDDLYRHRCPKAENGEKANVKTGKAIVKILETGVNEGMAHVLTGLHDDEIGRLVNSEELLLEWLEFKVSSGFWKQKKWTSQVRAKLRLGARLLLQLRKKFPDITLRDALVVDKFDQIVEAVKACAQTKMGKEAFDVPVKMGHLLSGLIKRIHVSAIRAKDKEGCEEVSSFKKMMEADWGTRVTVPCCFSKKELQRNEEECIPTRDDTVKFAGLLKTKLADAIAELEKSQNYAKYRNLQEVTLARIMQFNRKRGGEVSEVKVEDLQKAMNRNVSATDEIFLGLSEDQQKLASEHKLLVLNGKCNQDNNCILDSSMVKALDLLIQFRHVAAIHPENKFIFALQRSKDGFLNASKIRAKFVEESDVQKMVARGMRKYVATTLQVLQNLIPFLFVQKFNIANQRKAGYRTWQNFAFN